MSAVALLAYRLRLERRRLPLWIGAIALLTFASSAAVSTQFADPEEQRVLLGAAALSPAFRFLRGLPLGIGTGQLVFFQIFTYLAALAGLMSTFLVVRHTRADEEAGRAELIAATPLRRTTPVATALTVAGLANLALGVAVALALAIPGLPWPGSVLTGLAVAVCGLVFTGIAAIAGQVLPSSRAANGAAAGAVGLAYLLRGIGDAMAEPDARLVTAESGWPSWLSPIGWGQRVQAYQTDDPAPLAAGVVAAAILASAAMGIAARRDLGGSLVRERAGPERAVPGLRSPLALAWRLHRLSLLGWAIAAAFLGAIAGLLAPAVADAVGGNQQILELIRRLTPGSEAELLDLFVAAILGIAGFLAAAAGAQAAMRLRSEETEGRAELLLSVPIDRARWMLAFLAVAAASVAAVLTPAGVAAAVAFAAVGEPDRIGSSLAAAAAQLPAALVFAAVTALIFAVRPRLTVPGGWSLLGAGLILGEYGELLGLPDWMQELSPFRHTSALPAEELDTAGVLALLTVAVASGALAVALFRRRDLVI